MHHASHGQTQTIGGGYNYVVPHDIGHHSGNDDNQSTTMQHVTTFTPGHPPQATRYAPGPYFGSSRSEHMYVMDQARSKETPQYAQPQDPDLGRFYQVQEMDGSWTRRNRRTIDKYMSCKWCQRGDGTWFAIRLRDD